VLHTRLLLGVIIIIIIIIIIKRCYFVLPLRIEDCFMESGWLWEMLGQIACETRWTKILASFERHHDTLITAHTDPNEEIGSVHTALVRTSPRVQLADRSEVEKAVLCKHYEGNALFTGILHLYTDIHR
jgi:hypothetical protein